MLPCLLRRVSARRALSPLACLLASLGAAPTISAAPGDFTQDATGITLETSAGLTRIEVWRPGVVRVLHAPAAGLPAFSSLSVVATPEAVPWQFQNSGGVLSLTTASCSAGVEIASGRVSFRDGGGAVVLAETPGGTSLQPTTIGASAEPSLSVRQDFTLSAGEAVYGFGQHQDGALNRVGRTITLLQENTKVGVPVWLSNQGYAVLWDNPAVTVADVGATSAGTLSVTSEAGAAVDYYFCHGPAPDQAIAGYRALTGAAPMFGKWAWGLWQSKERYQTQQELIDVADQYRTRGIPLDGIVQDWQYWPALNQSTAAGGWGSHEFDPVRYPDPSGLMAALHARHVHTLISVWAKFDVTNSGVSIPNLQALEAVGGAFSPAIPYVYPAGQGKWYDPFRPAARQVYWNELSQKIFARGWDGWWLDASEAEFSGKWGEFRNFTTALGPGAKVFNAYPLLHTSAVYEGQRAETAQKRAIILTRSAYAGQQRNAAITWSGDIQGNWDVFAKQIPAGLNFTATGIPYWNTDIGGFFGGDPATAAYAELFTRWFQFGAFTPMFRIHGTNYGKEIWRFPASTQPILTDCIRLRYRLMPYIYSTAWRVTDEGYTMMRPLVMDFRADPQVNAIGNQFMFGPALLVNPVTVAGATSRSVYLPAGASWFNFWTGLSQAGGQTISASAPIQTMPLYVRAGSILPQGPAIQYASENVDPIELRVYPGANGSFTLYEDEGDNYNYESGAHATIPFTWNDATRRLSIGARVGSFPGMLANRTFKVVFVTAAHGTGIADTPTPDAVVTYDGTAVEVPAPATPPPPSAPTLASAAAGAAGITLSWSGPTEGIVYRMHRALQPGGPYTQVGEVLGTTSFLDTAVEPGVRYYYAISAANAGGESALSAGLAVVNGSASLRTLLLFNEASGTSAADASGHGWHATLVNGPARAAGKGGNAVDLDGIDDYVRLPEGIVSTLNDFTVTAWVRLDTQADEARILDFGTDATNRLSLIPRAAGTGRLRFAITTGGQTQTIEGTAALPIGAWSHVGVSISGDLGILYVDGVEVGRNASLTLKPYHLGVTTQNWIGRSLSPAEPYLDGRVDDFRIYGGALDAPGMIALYSGPAGALLSPWTGQDIGAPTLPGSDGSDESGANSVHLTASGSDIQGTSDQFHFVWRTYTGDSVFIARIGAEDAADPWTKAGLMVRGSLVANALNGLVAVTPQNGVTFQYRTANGGATTWSQAAGLAAPQWLKLERSGNTFTAHRSADGIFWSQIGSVTLSSMPATAYYGLALTAHTNSAPAGTGFDHISLQAPPPPIPVSASATAPLVDANDASFLAPGGLNDVDNLGGAGATQSSTNDEATYLAPDRSSKGQTFTTGNHPAGYTLQSFSFQHVLWPTFLSNGTYYNIQPDDTFEYQFGLMAGSIKQPIRTGTAKYSGSALVGSGNSGSGTYLTFDLSAAELPVLAPNTTYYFEIAPAAGDPYFELNGSRTAAYTGGVAFRGNNGTDNGAIASGVNLLVGSRVFHASLTPVPTSGFDLWVAAHPGLGAASGSSDDPDGDGRRNLMEYAFGADPLAGDSAFDPVLAEDEAGHLTLSFLRIADDDLEYDVRATSDPAIAPWPELIWSSATPGNENTAGRVVVTDPELAREHARRFLRLEVSLPP